MHFPAQEPSSTMFRSFLGVNPVTTFDQNVRLKKTAGVRKMLILEIWIVLKLVENVNDGISTFLIRSGILGHSYDSLIIRSLGPILDDPLILG